MRYTLYAVDQISQIPYEEKVKDQMEYQKRKKELEIEGYGNFRLQENYDWLNEILA